MIIHFVAKQTAFVVGGLLLALLVLSTAVAGPLESSCDPPIAARVNGKAIPFSRLDPFVDAVLRKLSKRGARNVSEATRMQIQQEELDKLIANELLEQAGEKLLAKDLDQQADALSDAKEGSDLQPGHHQASADTDPSNPDSRHQVRRNFLVDEYLIKRGLKDLRVPEVEVKKYYDLNKKNFTELEALKVSHILIALPMNAKSEDVAKARKEIDQIRDEVLHGKDFAEVAMKQSSCASAASGGDLGYIQHGFMPREFDSVAFALKMGEVSEVVRTRHGFHLIKAFDKKPEKVKEFDEIKDFIQKFLVKEVQKKKIAEIVEELKREADIEICLKQKNADQQSVRAVDTAAR